MDATLVTAALGGVSGLILAVAGLLRVWRTGTRELRAELDETSDRLVLHRRIIEAMASLVHDLRLALRSRGVPEPESAAHHEAQVESLRAQLRRRAVPADTPLPDAGEPMDPAGAP